MLFKHKPTTQPDQLQTIENGFHREDNADYEPEVYDDDETDAEQSAQTPPQRTNPFPKKNFPGSPVVATATTTTPAASPATPVQPSAPATAPAPAPVVRQTEAERRRDPKLIQITLKIDRVLHGRVRYMTFKTGLSQSEILEELIRTHCPEVP